MGRKRTKPVEAQDLERIVWDELDANDCHYLISQAQNRLMDIAAELPEEPEPSEEPEDDE